MLKVYNLISFDISIHSSAVYHHHQGNEHAHHPKTFLIPLGKTIPSLPTFPHPQEVTGLKLSF